MASAGRVITRVDTRPFRLALLRAQLHLEWRMMRRLVLRFRIWRIERTHG